jgi:hypothetical protein
MVGGMVVGLAGNLRSRKEAQEKKEPSHDQDRPDR